MKKLFSTMLLIFVFLLVAQNTVAQGFPYHLYVPRTLSELTDINEKARPPIQKDSKNIAISVKPFYSAIRLEYAGKSRKLSKEKLGLFKIWAEALNVGSSNTNAKFLDLLDKEYLFKECDKEYWIPVQVPAANDFPKDMKKGDRITLYLMLTGGIETDGKWEDIYFTNSFKIY